MKEVKFLKLDNGKEPVREWLETLDVRVQTRINSRLIRINEGNYGDVKRLANSELSEVRFKFGKGYRIYFAEVKNTIILLINSGDKSAQATDIKKANEYFKLWKERNND